MMGHPGSQVDPARLSRGQELKIRILIYSVTFCFHGQARFCEVHKGWHQTGHRAGHRVIFYEGL